MRVLHKWRMRSFCGWLDVASGKRVVSEETAHKKSATYVRKHK